MASVAAFVVLLTFLLLFGAPMCLWVFKSGRAPPQSLPFLISLLLRRVVLPMTDLLLDWIVCLTFLASSKVDEHMAGVAVLTILVLGSIAVAIIGALSVQKEYEQLASLAKHHGVESMGVGCLAGFGQFGPIFLGVRACRAWCEITDNVHWRSTSPDAPPVTQEAINAFVELTADIKHSVQFQALYEGGPQLVVQLLFLVRDRDYLGTQLSSYELAAWIRLLSVGVSTSGLVLTQMDWLCENDRFLHRVWKRDGAPVMLTTLLDCTAQLATSVVPLVMLLDHNVYAGIAVVVLQICWSAYVTRASGHDAADEEECIDLFLVPFLFFPHAFFFAMTYYPGHHEDGPNRGGLLEFHTARSTLLSQSGLTLAASHVIWSLIIGGLCALLPPCCYDWFDPDTSAEDFNPQFRVQAAFTTLGIAAPLLIICRCTLYHCARNKPTLFDQVPPPPRRRSRNLHVTANSNQPSTRPPLSNSQDATPALHTPLHSRGGDGSSRMSIESRALSYMSEKSIFLGKVCEKKGPFSLFELPSSPSQLAAFSSPAHGTGPRLLSRALPRVPRAPSKRGSARVTSWPRSAPRGARRRRGFRDVRRARRWASAVSLPSCARHPARTATRAASRPSCPRRALRARLRLCARPPRSAARCPIRRSSVARSQSAARCARRCAARCRSAAAIATARPTEATAAPTVGRRRRGRGSRRGGRRPIGSRRMRPEAADWSPTASENPARAWRPSFHYMYSNRQHRLERLALRTGYAQNTHRIHMYRIQNPPRIFKRTGPPNPTCTATMRTGQACAPPK